MPDGSLRRAVVSRHGLIDNSGFSLLEVLLSLLIIAILTASIFSTIFFIQQQTVISELRQKAKRRLSDITSLLLVKGIPDKPVTKELKVELPNGKSVAVSIQINPDSSTSSVNNRVVWNYSGSSGVCTSVIVKSLQ